MKRTVAKTAFPALISLLCLVNPVSMEAQSERIEPWSVELSWSPRLDREQKFLKYSYHYLWSFNLNAERRISDHFSLSAGVSYDYRFKHDYSLSYVPTGFYYYSVYGIPVELKYYLKKGSPIFSPYLATALTNSYSHFYFRHYSDEGTSFSRRDDHYFIFLDSGIGSCFAITRKLSVTAQVSYGIGLKYYATGYSYIETLAGIRYAISK